MQYKHKVKIENSKFKFVNKAMFDRELSGLEGKEVFVTIKEAKESRSDNQNRYYFGVVLKLISDETGNDVEDIHEYFKVKFLGLEKKEILGYEINVLMTTTKLNTKEFEEYLENIRRFASKELGIVIPEPNQVDY